MEPVIWHFNSRGQTGGPVGLSDLRQMVASGELASGDSVWCQGWADWRLVSSVRELNPEPTAIPSPFAKPGAASANVPRPAYVGYSGAAGYGGHALGQSYNGYAIAGFVLALTFPLLGVIFSWIALNGMKSSGNEEGRGLALAGMIISIVFLSLGCLMMLAWFTCLGVAVNSGP
jgi:hypothetical protein